MNYIKLFEHISDGYSIISFSEKTKYKTNHRRDAFTNQELDKLELISKDVFKTPSEFFVVKPPGYPKLRGKWNTDQSMKTTNDLEGTYHTPKKLVVFGDGIFKGVSFEVSKYEDEWFLLSARGIYSNADVYYLCDQFDGLVNAIEINKLYLQQKGISLGRKFGISEGLQQKYYIQISEDEYCSNTYGAVELGRTNDKYLIENWEKLSPIEINKIVKVFKSKAVTISIDLKELKCYIDPYGYNIKLRSVYRLEIYTLEHGNTNLVDEYNIVKLKNDWFYLLKSTNEDENYYKCDQLEGLIQCLEEI